MVLTPYSTFCVETFFVFFRIFGIFFQKIQKKFEHKKCYRGIPFFKNASEAKIGANFGHAHRVGSLDLVQGSRHVSGTFLR